MFWYTIFISIQRLCYFFWGGGSITEALRGVGVQGEKSKKNVHLRVTEEQRAQLILRGRGTGKIWGTREQVPSSLPGRASSVVYKVF